MSDGNPESVGYRGFDRWTEGCVSLKDLVE